MDFRVEIKNNEKQLWLIPHEIESGLKYALENNIKSLFLWKGKDIKRYPNRMTIDFSWLKELSELENLDIMIHLTKQSDINSLYEVKGLKKLTYFEYDYLPLDHSKLKSLELLYTHYSKNHKTKEFSFETLENLRELKLWHIKNEEDCMFLGNMDKLKRLELTFSRTIKTLDGISKLKSLEKLALRNLFQLENALVLLELKQLKGVWIDTCKKINEESIKIIKKINNEE